MINIQACRFVTFSLYKDQMLVEFLFLFSFGVKADEVTGVSQTCKQFLFELFDAFLIRGRKEYIGYTVRSRSHVSNQRPEGRI